MDLTRRTLFATTLGAAATSAFPSWAANNGTASRSFKATRGSSSLGEQKITLSRSGDRVTIDLETKLNVKILGVSLYKYRLKSREVWEGDQVIFISGKTDDNGKPNFVEARRTAAGLDIKGSGFTGLAKGNVSTTSFFTTDLINRKTWISTQNGKVKNVASAKRGATTLRLPTGEVACNHYYFGGDLNIPVDAYFDKSGDLIGYMFDAKGERAKVIAVSNSPQLRAVWG